MIARGLLPLVLAAALCACAHSSVNRRLTPTYGAGFAELRFEIADGRAEIADRALALRNCSGEAYQCFATDLFTVSLPRSCPVVALERGWTFAGDTMIAIRRVDGGLDPHIGGPLTSFQYTLGANPNVAVEVLYVHTPWHPTQRGYAVIQSIEMRSVPAEVAVSGERALEVRVWGGQLNRGSPALASCEDNVVEG